MSPRARQLFSRAVIATAVAGLVATPLVPASASAAPSALALNPAGTGLVISEIFPNGGGGSGVYTHDFVELYNPTTTPITFTGETLQYRGATGAAFGGVTALTGTVPAEGHFLVRVGGAGAGGTAIPVTPDQTSGSPSLSAASGTLALAPSTTPVPATPEDLAGSPAVIDAIGWGSPTSFEAAASSAGTNTETLHRTDGIDTDDNSADFSLAAPTPTNAAGDAPEPPEEPEPPAEPTPATIAEIQGTGDASPLDGENVVTEGVVIAAYPTGGLDGFYIQAEGTGGPLDGTHDASDGVFVYDPGFTAVEGDLVEVTGVVDEYFGLTQVVPGDFGSVDVRADAPEPVEPAEVAFPGTDAGREVLEGMLLAPQGDYTVTNNFNSGTSAFGEIGLAAGDRPLRQPTDDARPGTPAYDAIVADNAARQVLLDDGASINFLGNDANKDLPLPYFTGPDAQVRVGAAVTFTGPVVLSYGFNRWRLQPIAQVTDGDVNSPVTFEETRTPAPEDVGGDVKLAAFNVLNYFVNLGADEAGCDSFDDRDGNPIVTDFCNVRGAYTQESFDRQEAKIVAAISALDADVVALQEIENAQPVSGDRDQAVAALVEALNADAGADTWAFAPSPAAVPAGEDVIRTAFIYKPAVVTRSGQSRILVEPGAEEPGDPEPAFTNARQPLAQAFRPVGSPTSDRFVAIANHFKSKSCSGSSGDNVDSGDGQACFNGDRVRQAEALLDFADTVSAAVGSDQVFLLGDFNSYTEEDPLQVFEEAGWTNVAQTLTDEDTYSFSGLSGSLDHVFASPEALDLVTGADIWNINSVEPVAYEYSRFNYNITNLYDESPYRASDHDPVLVGLFGEPALAEVELNLLNINDFHGRIDANTVQFAGTIERLREEAGEDNTLFLSAGDNIGASLFASAVAQDQPTIDVLNTLELAVSAVGNHEFDAGYDDLVGRVSTESDYPYLGANVYDENGEPALEEFAELEVDGLTVGVVGAVTQETPALVTPAGIEGLEFGDPVEAVNRVVAEHGADWDLTVVEYHEGAGTGTLEDEIARGGAFASIVNETDADVDAIFTGHTHNEYAFDAPVPGLPGETRPIVQTGSYGENIGQIELTIDTLTGDVTYEARNVPRTTVADDVLISDYPRVAEVNEIVEAAIADAAVVGNQPIAEIAADITTAFAGTPPVRDAREAESTLGNLVANALRDKVGETPAGEGAQIGVVNPGGLRADLLLEGDTAGNPENTDGVVTYAEANAVLPFVNNLWSVTMTGAEFTTVLEQQWQRDEDGNVPTRPYLQLGLSDNVTYTFDEDMPEGERITSVIVDGQPLDPAAEYKVATFSFLATGGDNFRGFTEGEGVDTGLIDREAWIEYLGEQSEAAPIAPSFERRSVRVDDQPTSVAAGDEVSFTVGRAEEGTNRGSLDLTSLGSPTNELLSVGIVPAETPDAEPTPIDDFAVTDGAATVSFTVPTTLAAGDYLMVLTASPSGTEVVFPVTVGGGGGEPEPGEPTVTATARTSTYGTGVVVNARVRDRGETEVGGIVEVRSRGRVLGTGSLSDGRTQVELGGTAVPAGVSTFTVLYVGDQGNARTTVDVRVRKADSRVSAEVTTSRVVVDRTRARVRVDVTAAGLQPSGPVVLRSSGRVLGEAVVRNGKVALRLETFDDVGVKNVTVRYLGDTNVKASSSTFRVRVVRG